MGRRRHDCERELQPSTGACRCGARCASTRGGVEKAGGTAANTANDHAAQVEATHAQALHKLEDVEAQRTEAEQQSRRSAQYANEAVERAELAETAANTANGHAAQIEATHAQALHKLEDVEAQRVEAELQSRRSAQYATEAVERAELAETAAAQVEATHAKALHKLEDVEARRAEAEQHAAAAKKAEEEVMTTDKQLKSLLTHKTSSALADLYRRDSQPSKWGDLLHGFGMAAIVVAILAMHVYVIDGSWFNHAAATLPLWFCVAVINRSFNDRRMVRGECAHAERVITAVIGFKNEFGEDTLNQPITADSPIGKVLAAIERNPAKRMKVGTDGLWGVIQAFADRKDKGSEQDK